jgi:hypothetical protein
MADALTAFQVSVVPRGSLKGVSEFLSSHGTNLFCTFLNTSPETKPRVWRNTYAFAQEYALMSIGGCLG